MNSLQHRENDRQKKKTGRWQYGCDKNPIRCADGISSAINFCVEERVFDV